MTREYSPDMRDVITRIQNAPDDKRRFVIADEFLKTHYTDVQSLLSAGDWRTRAANIDKVAGIQGCDMNAVLVAAAMLDKLGVTTPTADQLIKNGEIAYHNGCGCYTSRTPYER